MFKKIFVCLLAVISGSVLANNLKDNRLHIIVPNEKLTYEESIRDLSNRDLVCYASSLKGFGVLRIYINGIELTEDSDSKGEYDLDTNYTKFIFKMKRSNYRKGLFHFINKGSESIGINCHLEERLIGSVS